MSKKIVFFDIDGTLLNDRHEIPASTKKAVRSLQQNGIHTAIATGRIPVTFQWILRELNIDSYVSINGQYVVFEGKTVYANPMDTKALDDMSSLALTLGHAMAYCSDTNIGVTDNRHPFIRECFGGLRFPYEAVDRSFYRSNPIYQCNLFMKAVEEPAYLEQFPEYRFVRWHENSVDVLPKGASKAVGIEKLLQIVGIGKENSYAFGDGINDVEMLSAVGVGIAMGNAVQEAKAAADLVTSSSSEDGIRNGLRMVQLLDKIS